MARSFLLYLQSTTIFSNQKSLVSLTFLRALVDLEHLDMYDWGSPAVEPYSWASLAVLGGWFPEPSNKYLVTRYLPLMLLGLPRLEDTNDPSDSN